MKEVVCPECGSILLFTNGNEDIIFCMECFWETSNLHFFEEDDDTFEL